MLIHPNFLCGVLHSSVTRTFTISPLPGHSAVWISLTLLPVLWICKSFPGWGNIFIIWICLWLLHFQLTWEIFKSQAAPRGLSLDTLSSPKSRWNSCKASFLPTSPALPSSAQSSTPWKELWALDLTVKHPSPTLEEAPGDTKRTSARIICSLIKSIFRKIKSLQRKKGLGNPWGEWLWLRLAFNSRRAPHTNRITNSSRAWYSLLHLQTVPARKK